MGGGPCSDGGGTVEEMFALANKMSGSGNLIEKRVFAGYDCVFARGRLADVYIFKEGDGEKLMNGLFLVDLCDDIYSFSKGIKGDYISMHVENSSVHVEPRNRGASKDVVMEIASVSEGCRDVAREKLEGLVNK